MHSMGKTVTELPAMLKLHEKTLPPKEGNQGKGKAKMGNAHVPAPSYAPKLKNPSTPKKDNPAKNAICHQCGKANLIYFNAILRDNIYEIVMSSSVINDSSMFAVSSKRAKLNLDSALLWHCHLGHINKKIEKLQHDGLLDSTDIKSFEKCVACMSGKMARKPYSHQVERAKDLLRLIHTDEVENQLGKTIKSLRSDRGGYLKETIGYSFYYPPENKVFVARNAVFLENSLINQKASGSLEDLEVIQEEDTHPSLALSFIKMRMIKKLMNLKVISISFVGDLGEPANYKAALLDPESEKWLNAMNVEMKSMKDNKVWELVDLPPDGKTDHLEIIAIPVADIRAIRILIAIVAFYDYEIWQMDVKTAFLNGYLIEEVYMEQPEGFVSQKYPNRVCKLKRSIYGLKQASRQ
ncbi:retrotransposon protein, putative, ty1-copia subclass [Tanacetum coccineum]